jgi:glycosyltransferase involved in cell wall biosynthesis
VPPEFSIVTPSFRQLEWLKLCAASVADQEDVEVEHIVQDAGTGAELETWAATQPGLKLFVEKDKGMYDAINRGLRRASGDILAYLNCDEQYLPGALSAAARFFNGHPNVDVLFGNVVVVDRQGDYICSREVLPPLKYHTWVCTLGVFTAATFFRRRIIDVENLFFSDEWRALGDAVWVLELLNRNIQMATLPTFTTVFADTGENLGVSANTVQEQKRLRESAPRWVQRLAPLWAAHHRFRKLLRGIYFPKKLSYSIFTPDSPTTRQTFVVDKPKFIWPGRFR